MAKQVVCTRWWERTGLQDSDTVVLEHMQQRRLAGIIEAKKQQLRMLVQQPEGGEHIEDYPVFIISIVPGSNRAITAAKGAGSVSCGRGSCLHLRRG